MRRATFVVTMMLLLASASAAAAEGAWVLWEAHSGGDPSDPAFSKKEWDLHTAYESKTLKGTRMDARSRKARDGCENCPEYCKRGEGVRFEGDHKYDR